MGDNYNANIYKLKRMRHRLEIGAIITSDHDNSDRLHEYIDRHCKVDEGLDPTWSMFRVHLQHEMEGRAIIMYEA